MIRISSKRKVVVAALLLLSLTTINNIFAEQPKEEVQQGQKMVSTNEFLSTSLDEYRRNQLINKSSIKYKQSRVNLKNIFKNLLKICGILLTFLSVIEVIRLTINNNALHATGALIVLLTGLSITASADNPTTLSWLRTFSLLFTFIFLSTAIFDNKLETEPLSLGKKNAAGLFALGFAACSLYLHTKIVGQRNSSSK